MPKSRKCAPSTANDGIWFQTRGWSDPALLRDSSTSTGIMLSTTYKPEALSYPKPPPQPFSTLAQPDYMECNPFSSHDNRHSFQDHGVYFGHGLGRHHFYGSVNQHESEDPVTGKSSQRHFNSSYRETYQGKACKTPPTRRRFPKVHNEAKEGRIKLHTTTTDWYKAPDVPYKTSTQTLVSSKEPHLKPNPWKYSYQSLMKE
ncbi:testis-expressed protein 36-like [Amphiura filiformis]|uniref:testis-expressed protein 36-like n=1 Tax=Amphiura filiformis TaxID=82378 RepID=UPI003B21B0B2